VFQFRLSTLFIAFAVIAAFVGMWHSYAQVDRSVKLIRQSEPELTTHRRAARQSYDLSQSGSTYTFTVSFADKSYPSQICPQIEWTFQLSDGSSRSWLCNGLVVQWEIDSDGNEFLEISDVFQGNTPYEVVSGASYRIVKHWWVEPQKSPNSLTQKLHLYLIANGSERILAEHQLTIVVNVVVPNNDGN